MSVAVWFWVIFVIGLLVGGVRSYQAGVAWLDWPLFIYILIALLGVGTFGSPIK